MQNSNNKRQPKIPLCGVVEGFFGPPWKHSARMRMMEFMAQAGLNSYIYAPKDDPFHRDRWREDYPAADAARLARLIRHASSLDVDFCWALSPGLSIKYSSASHFRELADKFASVACHGVRTFALFLDDIPEEIQYAADKRKFTSLAEAHADLANRLDEKLSATVPGSRLLFCPTAYFGAKPSPYMLTLGEKLTRRVGVFWTGPQVVSPSVTAVHAGTLGKVIRRKPLLWDNYPVNDYNRSTTNIGPLRGRDPRLASLLDGYYTNPMNEPAASRIPMLTISDWLRAPQTYDPDKSFRAAVARECGRAALAPMSAIASFSGADVLDGLPRPAPDELLKSILSGGKAARLRREIKPIENLSARLRAAAPPRDILSDLAPRAAILEKTALAVSLALDALSAPPEKRKKILAKLIPLAKSLRCRHRFISREIALREFVFDVIKSLDPDTVIENWTANELFVKGIMN